MLNQKYKYFSQRKNLFKKIKQNDDESKVKTNFASFITLIIEVVHFTIIHTRPTLK